MKENDSNICSRAGSMNVSILLKHHYSHQRCILTEGPMDVDQFLKTLSYIQNKNAEWIPSIEMSIKSICLLFRDVFNFKIDERNYEHMQLDELTDKFGRPLPLFDSHYNVTKHIRKGRLYYIDLYDFWNNYSYKFDMKEMIDLSEVIDQWIINESANMKWPS